MRANRQTDRHADHIKKTVKYFSRIVSKLVYIPVESASLLVEVCARD